MTIEGERLPLTVTIPSPIKTPRKRGIHAVQQLDPPVSVRFSPRDRELVELAAYKCGMTIGLFIRWCAAQTAIELLGVERDGESGY